MADLKLFIKAMNFIGIPVDQWESFIEVKKYIMNKNKLLITIAPSENFWIKSEKDNLNGHSYDKKLNNYNNIFYFWYFVRQFYAKVASHPRCVVGIISSMLNKNIKPCMEFISIDVGKFFTKFLLFDQGCHDNLKTNLKAKPVFNRNFEKVINTCKCNQEYDFNETNIVFVDSEPDKIEKTKGNTVLFNCFSEDYFYLTKEKQKGVQEKVDGLIEYLLNLLEECETDVRDYLSKNSLNN
jgi:hypothetical protein